MALKWSTKLQHDVLAAVRSTFTNGVVYIYSGAQPIDGDAAVQGTLLGKLTVGAAAFAPGQPAAGLNFDAPANKVLSKAAAETWQFVGLATGVAGWFRHMGNALDDLNADQTKVLPRMDGRIGGPGSGAEMILSNVTVTQGATTTIDSYALSLPAGLS